MGSFVRKVSTVLVCMFVLAGVFTLPTLAQTEEVHTIQPGENLFRIALSYGVDVETLAEVNNITNVSQIYVGQTLIIPGAPYSSVVADAGIQVEAAATTAAEAEYHTVLPGERLQTIAAIYGLTVNQLAALNDITNPNLIYAGQRLLVTPGIDPTVAVVAAESETETVPELAETITISNVTHTLQPGEHLQQVAEQYGVSWMAIAQANNVMNPNRVFSGQELVIPVPAETVADFGIVMPAAPAAAIGVGKEIIVDLSDSRIYAYENGRLVRNALMSPGLSATPTVQGSFTVQRKYAAQTMSGPGYYLPEVPWVMYFFAGYAIHGAYWHENWGEPMSHGCVNLPPDEAKWFYDFAPVGTPVNVRL